ncbi:MAG TPA: M23 family metallopeptidase [Gryllotalpicola sp.]
MRVLTALVASLALVTTGAVLAPSAAWADQYPSWSQVQKAKADQSAAQAESKRITALLHSLQSRASAAQRAATDAGTKLQTAQSAYFAADQRYQSLKGAAARLSQQSDTASTRAGQVAAQLYRSGGHNLTVSLLFADSNGTDPRDLLSDLGSMTKLTESTSDLWAQAEQAKNTAAAASDQAKSALDERTRLQKEAQQAFQAAVAASAAAQQAATAEQQHSDQLKSMVAALANTSQKTVAAYQKGVAVRAAAAKAAAEKAAREAAARAGQVGAQGWAVPVSGWISAGFGPRPAPCAGCTTWHEGVDIAAAGGTPIHAAHAGTVTYVGWYGGYGNFILIDDGDGMSTAYGHIIPGGFAVSAGQHVTAGQVIAHVGSTGHSTGYHLHFEVRQNGIQINPIDWMAQHGASL